MTEKQFRHAVQINTKIGKRFLNEYCKNHDPFYSDEEYNEIIKASIRSFSSSRKKKSVTMVTGQGGLTYIKRDKK